MKYYLKNGPIRINNFGLIRKDLQSNFLFFNNDLDQDVLKEIKSIYDEGIAYKICCDINSNKNCVLDYHSSWGDLSYLFCNVTCDADGYFCVTPNFQSSWKLFVNNQLVAMNFGFNCNVLTLPLLKGENIIIIELATVSPGSNYSLRISPYKYELKNDYTSLIQRNLLYKDNLSFLCIYPIPLQTSLCSDIYTFVIFPTDCFLVNGNQNITCNFRLKNNQEIIDSFQCQFCKAVEYDIKALKFHVFEDLDGIELEFEFYDNYSNKHTLKETIYNKPVELERIVYPLRDDLSDESMYYKNVLTSESYQEIIPKTMVCGISNNVELAKPANIYMLGKLSENVYYHSFIDDTYEYYTITLPINYNNKTEYPLVIFLSYAFHMNNSQIFKKYADEDVVFVDIWCRGMTTGSYVAEAAMFEILDNVFRKFNIDKSRIYMAGTSNGAYAALAFAQNYPHLLAGIYIVSGGAYIPNIKNMNGIKIINISSKDESLYHKTFLLPNKSYRKLANYKGYLAKNMTHEELSKLIFKEQIITDLIKYRKNTEPEHVFFRTEHNYHNRAYWITIHAISFGKFFAEVDCCIKNNVIEIKCKNVTGFTIDIPQIIDKTLFGIVINNIHKFQYEDCTSNKIIFVKQKRKYVQVENLENEPSNKGLGLLSIYLEPMRITTCINDASLLKVAEAFSTPSTNSIFPNVFTKYPIIPEFTDKNNLIIIDNNLERYSNIRKCMPVKTDKGGFEYKGIRYNCKYSIMQIKFINDKNILYINANNKKYYTENLFTRKVILPSYSYGRHPFWNNECLIFMDGSFYEIYEWGAEIKKINFK